jgi:polygalacturonase
MTEKNSDHLLYRTECIIILFICLCIPFLQATIPLPVIPATQFLITGYGASTSNTDNASFINATIAAANSAGGGTVVIPSGTFLSGPITMKSNVNLFISSGAILQILPYGNGNGSPAGSYPNNGTVDTYANFIFGSGLNNIEVSGTGTIEGNGSAWWIAYNENNNIERPCLIRFKACNTVLITGITLQNSPNVHVTLGESSSSGSNGTISNITVIAPSTSPNTDAIDTWYWNGINITHCNLSEGDDNVAMNSYSHNVTVTDCTFGSGHGVSVGSYGISVENILVDSCTFTGTTNGIRLKSERGRGGADSSFVYSNLSMTNVQYPIYITSWYPKEPYPASAQVAAPITSTTPIWKNILFKNITIANSTYGGIIYGLPEAYISNIVFDNVQLDATKSGLIANYITGLVFRNCSSITLPTGKGNAIIPYNASFTGINSSTGVSTDCIPSGIVTILANPELSCFPNPLAGDNLTVNAESFISNVKVYTLTGMEIKEATGNHSMQLQVNMNGILPGYYIVNVSFENGIVNSLKLIRE